MELIKQGDLVEKAYRALRKQIITNQLKPGEYLDEKKLITELSIGRTPLRQAFHLLKNENFVVWKPHRSPYIKELSIDEIRELFEALIIVEKNITYLAALRINDEELTAIRNIDSRINNAIRNNTVWEITEKNNQFHTVIARASNNRYLDKYHETLRLQVERLSYLAVSRDGLTSLEKHYAVISSQHEEIIEHLASHNTDGIEQVAVAHVKLFQNRILSTLMSADYL